MKKILILYIIFQLNNYSLLAQNLIAKINDIKNYRWKKISIVMQSALNALNPVLTIKSQINDVFEFHTDYNQKEIEDRIENLLDLISRVLKYLCLMSASS